MFQVVHLLRVGTCSRFIHDNARPIDNTQVSKLGDIQANPRTAMCLPSQSVYLQELILNYSFL